ncbi:MAG: signal peptide peptidase SppA [Phycisphaerae bacterium]|nr:signal peptide peptidase SppA [Phycisphaerae bacterium]
MMELANLRRTPQPILNICEKCGPRRLVLPMLIAVAVLIGGCGPTSFLITPVPADRELDESVLIRESAWTSTRIALIDVDGVLANSRPTSLVGTTGENPVSLFKEKLDRAASDKRVKAIVLRINSPGGTVTASDLMYTELMRFKQRTGKPVVACMLDVAASGGYYVACAADTIIAHPTTVTGSIGVIMMAPNISDTLSRIGAYVHIFKSGEMKDAGSPFREMAPADRELFQKLIDDMYARFLAVVAAGRPDLPEQRLRELADGRVFLAPDALENGLIDSIGTLEDAIGEAKGRAGLVDANVLVVEYARPLAHRPNVYARADAPTPAAGSQINLVNVELPPWLAHSTPQMLYMWAPGW